MYTNVHIVTQETAFAFMRVNKRKLTRIQGHAHIHVYVPVYARLIVYTQRNGVTAQKCLYKAFSNLLSNFFPQIGALKFH